MKLRQHRWSFFIFENWFYPWLFLGAYYLFCFITYKDYGITIDEPAIYGRGGVYLKYYFTPWLMDSMSSWDDATHNYIYSVFLEIFSNPGDYPRLHLLNLLFGSLIFIAVYQILWACYQKRTWALLGCFVLFLTPRFLGDLAENSKDTPFAILYFVSLVGIYLIPQRVQGWGTQSFWIGILIGLATCVRILGLTLLPVLVLYRLAEYSRQDREKPKFLKWLAGQLPQWLLVLFFSQLCMRMLWPYLDHDYFRGMLEIFNQSRAFWWDGAILFGGKWISPHDRIWTYLPTWFLITTPLFILGGLLFSFFAVKDKKVSSFWLLLSLAAGLNFLIYFVLKPVVYNALRLYLFLVPVFSVMGAIGLIEFCRGNFSATLKKIFVGLVALNILMVTVECFRLYPFDYLYFNEFTGGLAGAYGRYETDYQGASLKEASQWLTEHRDKNASLIRVRTDDSTEQSNYYFANNMKDQRELADADYWIAANQNFTLTDDLKNKVVYRVEREGVPLAYVLKLK